VSASEVSQILEFMGVNKIITLDLHANAVAGSVTAKTVFEDYEAAFTAIDFFMKEIKDKKDLCIVAPDAGAAKRA
jgi:phosphoribosylpyrophosphate synthetase